MREYELIIQDALKNGLTPFDITPFNTQILEELLGFRCGRAGLERYIALDNPLPAIPDMYYNWPFPQFITGERYNFLIVRDLFAHEDRIYSISDDHLTVTFMFAVDELTFGVGTLMEVADFGLYAFMTNGVIMIYWDVGLGDWNEVIASANIPMMRTVCNFKGQAVGGNIVSVWHDCDEKYYVWSNIGEINFNLGRKNEAGYKRDPYGGEVYHTRRLGDNVIGYSSKGVTILSPVSSPAATFGFTEVSDIGLINRGAINGNFDRHVYVGEDYILREVTKQGVKELGYKTFMKNLKGEDIIVSYEPSNKDFYIGNSKKTYLLSPHGLSEVTQHPSTVWRRDSDSHLLPDTIDTDKPVICTGIFDMGYKGQKTVVSMETDAMPVEGSEAGIDWANDLSSWGMEHYKPINNMGIAAITAAGNMFRFRLRFETFYEVSMIGYLKVRYKMTDLRGIRGVYAPALRGQAKGE